MGRTLIGDSAVVFVHPPNPTCCNPVNVGVPSAFAEWPFDTARTMMSLWVSNALLRWPSYPFHLLARGQWLPMIADRIDKFGRPGAGPDDPRLHDALSQIRTCISILPMLPTRRPSPRHARWRSRDTFCSVPTVLSFRRRVLWTIWRAPS